MADLQWYNGINSRFLFGGTVFSKNLFGNVYLWIALLANMLLQFLAIYNPYFQKYLKTAPLGLREWILILATGLIIIFAEELRRFVFKTVKSAKVLK